MLKRLFIIPLFFAVVTCIGQPTVLEHGDLAIVAVNANDGACSSSGVDIISFFCFKDINFGTTLDLTDNGWERLNAGLWGNNEGVVRIQRSGGTISAGTVITIRNDNGVITALSPDNQWTYTNQNPGGFSGTLNLNASSGDQLYMMQGGTWNAGTSMGSHNATYTGGKVLYGFSTNNSWNPFVNNSNNSGLFPSMACFSMAPSATSDFNKYTGPTTATTQRTWLNRIGSPANWTSYANCTLYASSGPDYAGGYSYTITVGGFREGWWYGVTNVWMDCKNWEDLRIPTATTDVTISAVDATNGPFQTCYVISAGPVCHSIDIKLGGALIVNNIASNLEIYKDFKCNGTLLHTQGIINFRGNENGVLSGTLPATGFNFQNIEINKTGGAGLYADTTIQIKGNSIFNSGIITHDADCYVRYMTSAAQPLNMSNISHVDGKVQKVGLWNFIFPTGNDGIYQPLGLSTMSNASNVFEAQFINDNGPATYGYNLGPGVNHVATCSHWILNRIQGSSARVSLSWGNDLDCGVDNLADLLVTRWDGSQWVSHGQFSTSGNAASGSVLSFDLINSFSPFALGSATILNPLPVEWLYFDASAISNKDVLLNWVTATETNNDYFSIEHTTNGIDFKEIGRVNGNGDQSSESFYEWTHQNVSSKDNYYRIRQVDYNGEFDYSNSVYVEMNNDDYSVQNYFANGSLQILFTEGRTDCNLQLFDLTGRVLLNKNLGSGNQFTVPVDGISPGVYISVVDTDGKQYKSKVTIP